MFHKTKHKSTLIKLTHLSKRSRTNDYKMTLNKTHPKLLSLTPSRSGFGSHGRRNGASCAGVTRRGVEAHPLEQAGAPLLQAGPQAGGSCDELLSADPECRPAGW